MNIDDYIARHIDAEPAHLRTLYRRTHLERLYPRMCSDHAQGRLLAMLTAMIRPSRIIELGTFTGYSALWHGRGDASRMPYRHRRGRPRIRRRHTRHLRRGRPCPDDITLHIGDALEVVPRLLAANTYDMAFVDANKRHYCEYFALLSQAMPGGSYILADNHPVGRQSPRRHRSRRPDRGHTQIQRHGRRRQLGKQNHTPRPRRP